MESTYFKGLEKALNEGCYITVFSRAMRYPIVRIEKQNDKTNQIELISSASNGNVLTALNFASSKIIDEFSEKFDMSKIWCDKTLIDFVIEQGYTLYFFKLPNNKVLSMICANGLENYIPIKSVIADDIKSSFETLNAALQPYDIENSFDFYSFAQNQVAPIYDYQKNLEQENTRGKIIFTKIPRD